MRLSLAILLGLGVLATAQEPAPATLTIHADRITGQVSPTLYGLMTEEINHSYDGGLYAELIRNRALKDDLSRPVGWTAFGANAAGSELTVDPFSGPSTALDSSLRWWIRQADAGHPAQMANGGYWGIEVRPNTVYTGSLYDKAEGALGPITVALVNNADGKVAASAVLAPAGPQWGRTTFTLRTGAGVAAGSDYSLVLAVTQPGILRLDLVSLFPPTYQNRANGDRPDLMQLLAGLHPAFLRFPGGNYLEGNHISDRFNWKETIGPLVDRPTHMGPWGYRSSDGLGLLEFLDWCEALHMQPVLAVYAGYSLRGEVVPPGAALAPYVQDALDEIEYVTGPATSPWGAMRARDGHPVPFALSYVEIGNEDNFDRSGSYDARFAQFHDAIQQAYPRLQLIATAHVSSRTPDVIDDHYYYSAERFFNSVHRYDQTDRHGPKIFVGEWATQEGSPTPDFGAALGDAAWMTGLERNSDIVIMASYAPLLVNVNPRAAQWRTNLIGFDAGSSYGSPSYYAQSLFAQHLGSEIVAAELSGAGPRLFYSATRTATALEVKIVNAADEPTPLELRIEGATPAGTARQWRLSAAATSDTNSIGAPEAIVPVASILRGLSADSRQMMPPYSITVLEVRLSKG